MSRVGEAIAMGIPVVNLLVWAGKRIAKRVRARRAARATGRPIPPVDMDAVREGIERGLDLVDTVRDADTPVERPSAKNRGLR